jgi:hypothetical protein
LKKISLLLILLFCLSINSFAGEAYFLKPDGSRVYNVKNQNFNDKNKVFTGRVGTKIQIGGGIKLELGKRTVIFRKDVEGQIIILLIKGRLRVKSKKRGVVVKTPVAEVLAGKGFSDIILANLNTLAVCREGEGLKITTNKEIQQVPVGKYVLVTTEGSISVNEFKSDE